MSRVYYDEGNGESWSFAMWAGRKQSVYRGKPAQKHFKLLKAALESLPQKKLANSRLSDHGLVCAIGAMAVYQRMSDGSFCGYRIAYDELRQREIVGYRSSWYFGFDNEELHREATDRVAHQLGITDTLAWLIQDRNDGGFFSCEMTPEDRWQQVYDWCVSHIHKDRVI